MRFSCSQCQTRYQVPDERVRGKRVRTKCRKCGAEILLEGPKGDGVTSERPTVPPTTLPPPTSLRPQSLIPMPPEPPIPAPPAALPNPPAFGFDDEATAVIAPDRARALLDAEMAKTADGEGGDARPPPDAAGQTFAFDDESTKVVDPAHAESLLDAQRSVHGVAAFPPRRSDPPPEPEQSVVLDAALGAAGPKPKAKTNAAEASLTAPKKPAFPSDLAAMQNEPTRVLRPKKNSNATFWFVLVLALAAAAAGGFVAAQMLGQGSTHAPANR